MQVEIVNVQSFPATDPKRIGQFDSLVIYRVDGKRADSLIVPQNPIDKTALEKAIVEHVKLRAQIIGHKFDIK